MRPMRSTRTKAEATRSSPDRRKGRNRDAAARSAPSFSVRSYPFFFMHRIIFKNNQNIGDALKHLGLTPVIWRLLALLQERDGISITELSEQSLIERTLLSRILADVEAKGLVRREPDPRDKRHTAVYLQPAGRKTFHDILPIAQRQIERAVAGIDREDLDRLQEILRRITENVYRSPYI
jgi:MarR family transcriptional regulator, organic hydroperoxide resistance regulator